MEPLQPNNFLTKVQYGTIKGQGHGCLAGHSYIGTSVWIENLLRCPPGNAKSKSQALYLLLPSEIVKLCSAGTKIADFWSVVLYYRHNITHNIPTPCSGLAAWVFCGLPLDTWIPLLSHSSYQSKTEVFDKQNTTEPQWEIHTVSLLFSHLVVGNNIESLMRVMNNIYAPIFFENTSWPDSIKNDFSAQLHKFLATLTDTR